MQKERKIRADEVTKRLGISIAKLISWQKKGGLPPAPLRGKKRYYTEEYLEEAKRCLEKYLSTKEVRNILGIADTLLQKLVKVGFLTAKLIGKQRFFLREEVEQLKQKYPTPQALIKMIKEQTGYSVSWLAKQLGISRQTLYTWLHRGFLSLPQKGGKVFITSSYVEEIKEKLSQKIEQAHKIRAVVLRSRGK